MSWGCRGAQSPSGLTPKKHASQLPWQETVCESKCILGLTGLLTGWEPLYSDHSSIPGRKEDSFCVFAFKKFLLEGF